MYIYIYILNLCVCKQTYIHHNLFHNQSLHINENNNLLNGNLSKQKLVTLRIMREEQVEIDQAKGLGRGCVSSQESIPHLSNEKHPGYLPSYAGYHKAL